MHRFLIEGPVQVGGKVVLPEAEAKHAAQVLRLKTGDRAALTDGEGGAWLCQVEGHQGRQVWVRVLETLPTNEMPPRITLYQGLPKGDKLDLIVQKATELGVHAIVPVEMGSSVARIKEKDGPRKQERWQRIAAEAAKQCGRAYIPKVALPMGMGELPGLAAEHELVVVPYELQGKGGMAALAAGGRIYSDIGLVIGPEGGFEPEEIEGLARIGAQMVTLGPRILRTETAAIAALAMLGAYMGDLGGSF